MVQDVSREYQITNFLGLIRKAPNNTYKNPPKKEVVALASNPITNSMPDFGYLTARILED